MTDLVSRVASIVRQVASVAAVTLGSIPATNLPSGVRAPLIAAGGVVLAIEHFLGSSAPPTKSVTTESQPVANEIVTKALDIAHQAVSSSKPS